jgi:hypothetical protein
MFEKYEVYGAEMPEPDSSHNTTDLATNGGDVLPVRSRFQFSLRTLLLFVLIVALAVTSLVMYRRMADAEKELRTLRDMAGYLTIDDEKLFYAIGLETYEPLTWRWRVHLPAGHKYSWRLESGKIPRLGLTQGSGVSTTDDFPLRNALEAIVSLSIRKNTDNKWIITSSCQSPDYRNSLSGSIPDDVMDQVRAANMTETEEIGKGKAISCRLDKPIVFLRYRMGEKQPNGSWKSSQNPTPGVMFWLEAAK